MSLITVIGRGHGGTRAMSHTLSESGIFMGELLNASGDLLPPRSMYDACRVMASFVGWRDGLTWDFDEVFAAELPAEFTDLVNEYLTSVQSSSAEHRGWKLPETTLVYPWITRMFPDARYVMWVRDPRDSILKSHLTDDLHDFGISYPETDSERLRRAISWKYQYDLVEATPPPANVIEVRFEDFILDQETTLARLEAFLDIDLALIPVRPESVGRWKEDGGQHYFDFLAPAMARYGYIGKPVVRET
ncbi:MAG: sulfotransferase [Chloroflexi bacterium]|nr:sulfotransferase [Chloroflexota bacterium]